VHGVPEGPVTITVTYTPERRDVWWATLSWLSHRPWLLAGSLLFPLALGVCIGALSHVAAIRYIGLSVGYTVLLGLSGLVALYVAVRVNRAALRPHTMTLGPSGIRLQVADVQSQFDWDSFAAVWMTRRTLVFSLVSSTRFISVPRAAFASPEAAEQCLHLARANMSGRPEPVGAAG
jgi:hypothetical protein